jgi:hypothetical protein
MTLHIVKPCILKPQTFVGERQVPRCQNRDWGR